MTSPDTPDPKPFVHARITPAATKRLRTLRGDFLELAPTEALEFVRSVRQRRNSPVKLLKAEMLEKGEKGKGAKSKGKSKSKDKNTPS
jgi:hypothetical protein